MNSLTSLHRRSLVAALSLVVLAVVACSSTSGEPPAVPATQTPSNPGDSAATATPTSSTAGAGSDNGSSPTVVATPTTAPAPSSPQAVAASNRIAITSADGSIYTIDPDGTNRRRVTVANPSVPGATFAAFYAWPIWSPDGRHLLVSAFTPDIAGGLETSLLRTSGTRVDANPELLYRDVPGTNGIGGVPHFPVWHPNGGSVALIANIGNGLSTFLIDVEDGLGAAVSNGAPVYLDWSKDGSHMLVHTAERLVLHAFGQDGKRTGSEQIGNGSISYRVPKFARSSDDFAYIDLSDGKRSLLIRTPSDSTPKQVRLARANNSFAWSPRGDRLAYADGSRVGFYETLRIIDAGGEPADDVLVDTPIHAFWWSPDGQRILIAMPGGEPENLALAVVDADSGDVDFLGLIEPSIEMAFVISFFDQYAADLRLWSPDSARFVFSGILKDGLSDESAGTQVQLGDTNSNIWVIDPSGSDRPISLGAGGFGTWSPE